MRLSAEGVTAERAHAVLDAAIAAGVRWFDTADVYAPAHDQLGHNERLLAEALGRHRSLREDIVVSTKGGLVRPPRGRWRPDGRAGYLLKACGRSLRALGSSCLDMYLLHAPDERVSLDTSVRALSGLKERGYARRIGLCNVTVTQLHGARQLADIDAVQVSLSPYDDTALYGGLLEYCAEHNIIVMAHSPFGGGKRCARLARAHAVRGVAQRHQLSPQQVVLAWLRSLAEVVMPLPGATQLASARSLGANVTLSEADCEQLDAHYPAGLLARSRRRERAAAAAANSRGEVVLLMGMPGAGKSEQSQTYVQRGYRRLNRDEQGGTLKGLAQLLDAGLSQGYLRWVLDNTYPTRAQRARVVETAFRHGAVVRCVHLDTPLYEAQINVVRRLLSRYDQLPDEAVWRTLVKTDSQAFGPNVQFRYLREFEPPLPDEGFIAIEQHAFERRPSRHEGRGLFVQLEALRSSASGQRTPRDLADLQVDNDCAETLRAHHEQGFVLVAFGWSQAGGRGGPSREDVEALARETILRLGVPMQLALCTHPAGPPRCWCRPPLPGLIVLQLDALQLDPSRCVLIGHSAADRTLAQRFGMTHKTPTAFFGQPA